MPKAIAFEQDNLRTLGGNYVADAPDQLHRFWLQFGLYVQFARTQFSDQLIVTSMKCVEDIS